MERRAIRERTPERRAPYPVDRKRSAAEPSRPRNSGRFHIPGAKLRELQAPTIELPPIDHAEKRFSQRNKIFIGNLKPGLTEKHLKDMLKEFGEIDDLFYNETKHFCFVKFDFRPNAERCKSRLDGKDVGDGWLMKVRFAPGHATIKVKNLGPMVSNELLHRAFSVFGPVERATVQVEGERARTTGEGIVEFLSKKVAQEALIACHEGHFVLTRSMIPVVAEPYEIVDNEDGLPDNSLNRRDELFLFEREIGPRFIQPGTFEAKFCEKYKQLTELRKEKQAALEREMKLEEEKLWAQMDFARHQYETEVLREQLRQREEESERTIKMMSEREAEVHRRMELVREEQRQREAMYNFNFALDRPVINHMMGPVDSDLMPENQRMALNPTTWSEFSPREGGSKRPRYPAEVFGRSRRSSGGGGGGSSGKGASHRYDRELAE